MYLQPESVDFTFRTIQNYSGKGSWVVFDAVHDSVLNHRGKQYGEDGIKETVSKAGEQWNFGLNQDRIEQFLNEYGMELKDLKNSKDLEKDYFTSSNGQTIGSVNGTHFPCDSGAQVATQIRSIPTNKDRSSEERATILSGC